MAEIEELRAKVLASMPSKNATSTAPPVAPSPAAGANPKPTPTVSMSRYKEDGEISSSSSGDLLGCPPAQSDVDASAGPSDGGLRSKQAQTYARGRILGNYASAVQPSRSAMMQNRIPTNQNYNKNINPFKYKPGQNSWIAPSGSNDNLVIRFSDDDTDSESEDPKVSVANDKKCDTAVTVISCKPSIVSQQLKPSHNTLSSRLQTTENRGFTNRSSVSTLVKAQETFQKVPGIPIPGKDLWCQKQNSSRKLLPSRNQDSVNKSMPGKKPENLHFEAELLENRQFQKNVNQNKRKKLDILGGTHDPSSINISHNATRFDRHVSSDKVSLITSEHSLKRQKVSEHSQAKFSQGEQSRLPKSVKAHDADMRRKITDDSCHVDGDVEKQQCSLEPSLYQTDLKSIMRQKEINDAEMRRKMTDEICHEDSDVGKQQCDLEPSLLQTDLRRILRQKEIPISSELVSGGTNKEISLNRPTFHAASNWRNSTLDNCSCDISYGSDQLDRRAMQVASSGLVQDAQLEQLSICAKDAINHQKSSEPSEAMAHFQSNPFIYMGHQIDIESLMNLEEIKDKELEVAQEHRRKCELEERRALKAYRKAQRDLINANEKCSLLYRIRELFSAQLRAFAMEGSNSLWSSRSLTNIGSVFDSMENRENEIPRSGLGSQARAQDQNMDAVRSEYRTNLRDVRSDTECRDFIANRLSHQHVLSSDLMSKRCTEPDIDVLHSAYDISTINKINNDLDSNLVRSITSELVGEKVGEKMVSVDVASEMPPGDHAHDYELEANLRSKLFQRLHKKAAAGTHYSNVKVVDSLDDADDISPDHAEALSSVIHNRVYVGDGKKLPDVDDPEIPIRSSYGIHRWHPEMRLSNGKVSEQIPCANEAWDALSSCYSMPSAALMVVSSNLKHILLELTRADDEVSVVPVKSWKDVATEFQMTTSNVICIEPFTYDGAIDPFWPFCMFELRGKCNNEKCPMQHLRDCTSCSQTHTNNQDLPTSGVRHCSITSPGEPISMNNSSWSSYGKKLFIPSYRIGSIVMKIELQEAGILLTKTNWIYWQMWFCTFFRLPFAIQRLSLDPPMLQQADSHTDHENSSKRLLANLLSQDEMVVSNVDIEECLDAAFYHYNSKPSKPVGRRKALSVLSRALEVNPESSLIWIVYLHMYYGKEKELGKDDMFIHAVQNCTDSFELWLMYVNSRMSFQSRMDAYDEALSVLCQKKYTSDTDKWNASACVLDLFLQMINFLCMSGNVKTAISQIHDLPNTPSSMLAEILSFLVFSDKCIFWICCVYLVVYNKLPEVVIQKFEFEKDITFGIDWPSVELTDMGKQQALEMMKMAVDAVDVNIDSHINKSEYLDNTYLRSLHFFAVNHVDFCGTVEGLECAASLLDEYISRYPTCIELYVLKSNCQKLLHNGFGFGTFEQALHNWPDGSPGIHCLWNQYASYALDCNMIDVTRELIDRWFSCFYGAQNPKLSEDRNDDSSNSAHFILVSPDAHGCFSSSEDGTFKMLNLWLHAVLQKDKVKARQVIDEALKEVSPQLFKHFAREHAAFCHSTTADSSSISIPTLLSYLQDSRATSTLHPLSRRFCQSIKNTRVRHSIERLLGPVSLDCSLLNSILDECYGPSLLPENFTEPRDLVDYIETLINISPANYKLAISAHKLAARSFKSTGAAFYGLMFWASSVLVNSLLQAFPVAPETAWLEVASLLSNIEIPYICERFHQHAVAVFPFSIGLWKSYYKSSKLVGDCSRVVESARIRGFALFE